VHTVTLDVFVGVFTSYTQDGDDDDDDDEKFKHGDAATMRVFKTATLKAHIDLDDGSQLVLLYNNNNNNNNKQPYNT
jgi:hypothetical protein